MKTPQDWLLWDKAFQLETEYRKDIDPDKLCSYGVQVLDDALFRIGPSELVVIGAETGQGKSDLALSVARHNAIQGRRVAIYFLEGGWMEAMQRLKWWDIAQKFYSEPCKPFVEMDFKRWIYNAEINKDYLLQLEAGIYEEWKQRYRENLFIFPTTREFTIDKFLSSLYDFHDLGAAKLDLDLLVIDHLQYFSLTLEENEIAAITNILREVKQIADYFRIPIILVSHLRKRGRKAGLPSHEDFYGSGNIAKISTTSIIIHPAAGRDRLARNVYPTYFIIPKCRTGVRPNYAYLVDFDLNRRRYADRYEIYRLNDMGFAAPKPLQGEEIPRWAKGAMNE